MKERVTNPALGTFGEIVGAGVIAGLIGAVLMAIFEMTYTAVNGAGLWMPPKLIASTLYGVEALVGGAGAIALGVVIHLVLSALFGILFALLPRDMPAGTALLGGVGYGIGIWLVMTYAILPVVNETMSDRIAMMPVVWLFGHLIFGAALALTPTIRRKLAHGRSEESAHRWRFRFR